MLRESQKHIIHVIEKNVHRKFTDHEWNLSVAIGFPLSEGEFESIF